jgi:hypothetical protein
LKNTSSMQPRHKLRTPKISPALSISRRLLTS